MNWAINGEIQLGGIIIMNKVGPFRHFVTTSVSTSHVIAIFMHMKGILGNTICNSFKCKKPTIISIIQTFNGFFKPNNLFKMF